MHPASAMHPAVCRKALCHGRLRNPREFAERFAKRSAPADERRPDRDAPESLAGRAFARGALPARLGAGWVTFPPSPMPAPPRNGIGVKRPYRARQYICLGRCHLLTLIWFRHVRSIYRNFPIRDYLNQREGRASLSTFRLYVSLGSTRRRGNEALLAEYGCLNAPS
jgi:hypothetical protein